MSESGPLEGPNVKTPSLLKVSAARLTADGISIVAGTMVGIITARVFGPGGKGDFSSLSYMITLASTLAALGAADSIIVFVGRREITFQESMNTTTTMLLVSAPLAAALMAGAAFLQFGRHGSVGGGTIALAALAVCVAPFSDVFTAALNVRERIVQTSIVFALTSLIILATIFIAVVVFNAGVAGGVAAIATGGVSGLVCAMVLLRLEGVRLRPSWSSHYAKMALRHGGKVQASAVLMTMAARFDLLLVYGMVGRDAAGRYSVALTLGQLVIYAPFALALAAYPRLARAESAQGSRDLVIRIIRMGNALALVAALIASAMAPIAVPLLFGEAFKGATVPAVIIAIGGVLMSQQTLVCRAWSARGRPELLLQASGVTLASILVLDLVLIPRFGIIGASIASTLGTLTGNAWCLTRPSSPYGRMTQFDLLPRPHDFSTLLRSPSAIFVRDRNDK